MSNSCFVISKSAFNSNIKYLTELTDNVDFYLVLKNNAYGHGIQQIARLAVEDGISKFAVFSIYEAKKIIEVIDTHVEIMIMGFLNKNELEWAIEHKLSFWVFNFETLEKAMEIANISKQNAKIHLEFDTGLGFTGFDILDIEKLSTKLNAIKNIEIEGVCSRLAGAENYESFIRIQNQVKQFKTILKKLDIISLGYKSKHIAGSAALLSYPVAKMDFSRIGIACFGLWPSEEVYKQNMKSIIGHKDPLIPILSWKTTIFEIRNIKKGLYLGEDSNYITPKNIRIAIIPIGSMDLYPSQTYQKSRVLIHGNRVPVLGKASLNLLIIDVSNIENVRVGDEVVLLGKQGEQNISPYTLAKLTNKSIYELYSGFSESIPRIIE